MIFVILLHVKSQPPPGFAGAMHSDAKLCVATLKESAATTLIFSINLIKFSHWSFSCFGILTDIDSIYTIQLAIPFGNHYSPTT